VLYRSQLGSASVESSNGASESIVSCEVLSLVGVPVFALTRLQNLVSGVWLKRRVSVAAEASGRGLVVGG
jgi:hypothetical protein